MKTNVIMTRKMGEFEVLQRTNDGMFNATVLLKQWNEFAGMQKSLDHFFENNKTIDFIEVLEIEENLHGRNSVYVKSRASRGANAGTWMHPFLFIKFAMWLNARFEYQVIKFVYDELIKYRHLAGDNYNKLCASLSRFGDVDYHEVGKILNYVVFNTHERGIRNLATPKQVEELQQLERDAIKYIDMGFVNNYAQFKSIMRKEWQKRYALQLAG